MACGAKGHRFKSCRRRNNINLTFIKYISMENNTTQDINNNNNPSVQEPARPKFEFSLGAIVKGAWSTLFDNLGTCIVASFIFIFVMGLYIGVIFAAGLLSDDGGSDEGVVRINDYPPISSKWVDDISAFLDSVEADGSVAVTNQAQQSVESLRAFVLELSTQIEESDALTLSNFSTENLDRQEISDAIAELRALVSAVSENESVNIDTKTATIALNNIQAYDTLVFSNWLLLLVPIAMFAIVFMLMILPAIFIIHFGLVAMSKGRASMRDLFPSWGKIGKYLVAYIGQMIVIISPMVLAFIVSTLLITESDATDVSTGALLLTIVVFLLGVLLYLYFSVKYAFVGYSILDRNTSIIDSFRDSSAVTKGGFTKLKIMVAYIIVQLIATIALFVTLFTGIFFFVMPFQFLAYVYIYKALQQKRESERNAA